MKCTRCGAEILEDAIGLNGEPLFKIGRMKFCSDICKDGMSGKLKEQMKAAKEKATAKKQTKKTTDSAAVMPASLVIESYSGTSFRYRIDQAKNALIMTSRESGIDCKIPIETFKHTIAELQFIQTVIKTEE